MTQDSTVVRVVVWKERKIGKKPAALGMVHIPLALLANATLCVASHVFQFELWLG